MPYRSVETSEEVEVYASWALIMVRMTYGSVGEISSPSDCRSREITSCGGRTGVHSFKFVVYA